MGFSHWVNKVKPLRVKLENVQSAESLLMRKADCNLMLQQGSREPCIVRDQGQAVQFLWASRKQKLIMMKLIFFCYFLSFPFDNHKYLNNKIMLWKFITRIKLSLFNCTVHETETECIGRQYKLTEISFVLY